MTAAVTVACMVMPFISVRAEKILREADKRLLAGTMALGLPKSWGLRKMVLPASAAELVLAVALGMAYGMGAAAPVMYTGAVLAAPVPQSVTSPFMSLPYHLYILAADGISMEYAYAAAFVLMAQLLLINVICRSFKLLREGAGWKKWNLKHK